MSVFATVISGLLGVSFLLAGVPKILRVARYRERIRRWRLPVGLLPVIGIVEVSGAGLLLVAAATQSQRPALVGAGLVAATMLGAILTHARIADPLSEALPAVALGALAVVLLSGQL